MRLPDSVQVGPHKIDIFQTPEISEYFGKFHYAKNLIELTTDGVSDSIIGDTLMHEILHVIWNQTQMNALLGIPEPTDDTPDREEAAIHVLGAQLFQLLRQNPKLVKFIIQEK